MYISSNTTSIKKAKVGLGELLVWVGIAGELLLNFLYGDTGILIHIAILNGEINWNNYVEKKWIPRREGYSPDNAEHPIKSYYSKLL